jgi:hypothetical protein
VAAVLGGGGWTIAGDLATLPADRLDLALHAEATALPLGLVSDWPGGVADRVPVRYLHDDGAIALLHLGDAEAEVDGPGGVEILTVEEAAPGPRILAPGEGEIWR